MAVELRGRPVFLAHGQNLPPAVEELLLGADLSYVSSADLAPTSDDTFASRIGECAAVVAFVGSNSPPAGVVLEIGAGLGLRLPVVLIVGPRVKLGSLPPALRELPSMRLPAPGSVAGRERLLALLNAAKRGAPDRLPSPPPAADHFPAEHGRQNRSDTSERRVVENLERLGASIVGYEPPNKRGRPDLAAWLPGLPMVPYNPVLVEVAGRGAKARQKELQLREYMASSEALVGLLVMADDSPPEWRVRPRGAVLVVGVEHLEELSREDLESLLRQGRNRLLHAS